MYYVENPFLAWSAPRLVWDASLFLFYIYDIPVGLNSTIRTNYRWHHYIHGYKINYRCKTFKRRSRQACRMERKMEYCPFIQTNVTSCLSLEIKIRSTLTTPSMVIHLSQLKEQTYKSLVRPPSEHTCSACDPTIKSEINQLEIVQWWVARFVINKQRNTSDM